MASGLYGSLAVENKYERADYAVGFAATYAVYFFLAFGSLVLDAVPGTMRFKVLACFLALLLFFQIIIKDRFFERNVKPSVVVNFW